MHHRTYWIVVTTVALLLAGWDAGAQTRTHANAQAGRRRAVLVGIDDYSASTLRARIRVPAPPSRDWPNLSGTVNDVVALKEMLTLLYDFEERDIVTLTNQQATRAAIVQSLEQHLAQSAAKGDVLLFYFAGHGSQRQNSLSDEPDRLDETIVPADSRIGANDIRDKELRPLFNRILDRGARLSVVLDNCYSGSGARGLATGARPRGIRADPRDLADRTNYGPRPEDRGALVIAATQDNDSAWETLGDDKKMHGAFSWAWLRAMRDSAAGEPAADTFARAAARMRAERPYQEPVLAGTTEVTYTPFLGSRKDRHGDRVVIAVEKVRPDGTIQLHGGWANGLALGTELRITSDRNTTVRVTVTELLGLGRSEGRIPSGWPMPQAIRSGALLEVVGWAAPAGRPLRVWMPRVSDDVHAIATIGRKLYGEASRRGVQWLNDPLKNVPSHTLRRGTREWELLGPNCAIDFLGPDAAAAVAAIAKLPPSATLFVQLPAPAALIEGIDVGPDSDREGIQPTDRADDADYILVGRYTRSRVSYAWVRPAMRSSDRRKSGLPVHTKWVDEETTRDAANALRGSVLTLRKIHAWHLLESPPSSRFPYRLGVRRDSNGEWAEDTAIGEEDYALYLRAPKPVSAVNPRFIYVFTIDSHGDSVLLYPRSSVENRYPRAGAQSDLSLGADSRFQIAAPYGVDTYFLLTTDEPLTNLAVLEWDGVRAPPRANSALEQLLLSLSGNTRAPRHATSSAWSVDRLVLEAVPPRESKKRR